MCLKDVSTELLWPTWGWTHLEMQVSVVNGKGCSPDSELYGCKGCKPGRDGIRPGSLLFQGRPVPCGFVSGTDHSQRQLFEKSSDLTIYFW